MPKERKQKKNHTYKINLKYHQQTFIQKQFPYQIKIEVN